MTKMENNCSDWFREIKLKCGEVAKSKAHKMINPLKQLFKRNSSQMRPKGSFALKQTSTICLPNYFFFFLIKK